MALLLDIIFIQSFHILVQLIFTMCARKYLYDYNINSLLYIYSLHLCFKHVGLHLISRRTFLYMLLTHIYTLHLMYINTSIYLLYSYRKNMWALLQQYPSSDIRRFSPLFSWLIMTLLWLLIINGWLSVSNFSAFCKKTHYIVSYTKWACKI